MVHYVRVSTDEQGKSGYSVREQIHTLNVHSAARGDEVVEEIADEDTLGLSGQAGPDARMDLAESGKVDVEELSSEIGSSARVLSSTQGAGSRRVRGQARSSKRYQTPHRRRRSRRLEREEITRRTLSGRLQKAREGKIIAEKLPVHGFRYTPDRDHYEVDEAKMVAVRRLFHLIVSGASVAKTARTLTEEGFPAPAGSRWQRPTVREIVFEDAYKPHSLDEVRALVWGGIVANLAPALSCGI